MNSGRIKLHRKMTDREWYDDANVFRLFMHLLLTVNHEEKKWRGEIIKPGEIITSYASLSEKTGLSTRSLRTCLSKLVMTGEIKQEATNKRQRISLIKWGDYQSRDIDSDKQPTNKGQSNDKQPTTTKEGKEREEGKEERAPAKKARSKFAPPMESDVVSYMEERGLPLSVAEKEGNKFFCHYESNGWMVGKSKMKNWKAAVSGWINRMNEYRRNDTRDRSKQLEKENNRRKKQSPGILSDVIVPDVDF